MDREDPTRFGRNAEDADLALSAGEKVGPYQIEGILGAGGMGKVYRALDPRLGRHVAVKFLAGPYAAGTVALERFQREARAISALNHPNVCTIYDIGEDRHGPFLVMELLEGQTLKQRVAAGRCSNEEIIAIGLQVSDALEAAHSQGIVHRDIKPANVFITKQGIAKILDFGLAKSISRAARGAVGLHLDDVTLGETLTKSDATLGTVAYMSPEQARGDDVDARTDLFSFGVVLYEMACGALPFPGDTWAVTFDAILNKQPRPIRERNPEIASEISQIIDKALEKERSVRYQTAADIQADLRRAKRNMESAAVAVAVPQAPSRRLPWVVLLALLIVVGIGAVLLYRPNSSVTSPSEYVQITNFPDSAVAPSLSPDGKMVAFIRGGDWFLSRGQIYVKLLSGGESRRLTNDSDVKYGPVFTPDNSRVAFTRLVRTGNGTSWDTWTVPVLGGEPTSFLPNASGLIWTDSRDVIFSKIMGAGLHMGIVSSTETRSDEREIYYPSHERAMAHFSYASPDHKSVLLVEMDRTAQWQPCRLVPADGSNAGKPVGPQGACTAAAWSPDGKWMYFSTFVDGASHLWRQKFPDGTPQQLTFGPTEEEGIALAPDGESIITSLGLRHREIWIHESGGDRRISAEGFPSMPRMSADGKRVYYLLREKSASSSNELLSYDVQTGKVEKILAGLSIVDYDISSDQQQVAFTTRTGNEPPEIWLAFVDRRMPPRKIATAGDEVSFGPKGVLIFRLLEEKANYLGRINEDGSGRERISKDPILNKGYVSPGGDWTMALVSAIDGNTSVESVAIPLDGGPPRLICAATCPAGWSPDGRMFFVGQGTATGVDMGKVLTFPIAPGATLPNLPETGIDLPRNSNPEPPMLGSVSPGPGLTTYAFSKNDIQRNLFRIPLH